MGWGRLPGDWLLLCRAWGLKVHRYLRKEVSVAQITPQGLLAHKEEQPGLQGGVR